MTNSPLTLAGLATEIPTTFAVRLVEACIAGAPELLMGLVLAALGRHVIGDATLRHWFSRHRWHDLPLATAVGIVLPLGALGALGVVVALAAARVRIGALVAVGIAGGAMTPWSLVWGLDRAGGWTIAVLVLLMLIMASLAGLLVERLGGTRGLHGEDDPDTPGLIPAVWGAADVLRKSAPALAAALLASAAMSSLLPAGWYGHMLEERELDHALVAPLVPLPLYLAPETGMLMAMEAADSALPGVSWALLLGGTGVTLGLPVVLWQLTRRWRPALVTAGVIVLLVGLGTIAVEAALWRGVLPEEDSHAFDPMARPYHGYEEGVVGVLTQRAGATIDVARGASLGAIVLLGILAGLPRRMRGGEHPGRHAARRSAEVAIGLLLAVSAGALAYVYYPAPRWLFEEMRVVQGELGEAAGTGNVVAAEAALMRMDRLAARARPAAWLRGDWRGEIHEQMSHLRTSIAEARAALDDADPGEDLSRRVAPVHTAAREARAAVQR